MDINAYLIDEVVKSTTPPDETTAQTQTRREAIVAMFASYDPDDGKEAMIVCHCIEMQFLLRAAIHDACNLRLDVDRLARARAGAMALSKTWNQWVTKLEKTKHGKKIEAAEALKAAQANAATGPAPVSEPLTPEPTAAPQSKAPQVSARPEAPADRAIFDGAPPIARVTVPPAVRSPLPPSSNGSPAPAARPQVPERESVPIGSVPGKRISA